jgi:hypothetical protein
MLPMDVPGCHVLAVEPVEQLLLVTVEGDAKKQRCPDCGYESDDVHSYYSETTRSFRTGPVRAATASRAGLRPTGPMGAPPHEAGRTTGGGQHDEPTNDHRV